MKKYKDPTIRMIYDIVSCHNKLKALKLHKCKKSIISFPKYNEERYRKRENLIYLKINLRVGDYNYFSSNGGWIYELRDNGIWLGSFFTPAQVKIAKDVWLSLK